VSADAVFWLAAAGLVATCVAAIGARSLAEFSRHELGEICRRRNSHDRLGQILRRHDQAGLAAETLQVIATAVLIGAGVFWVRLEPPARGVADWMLLALIVGVGALLLLAVEIWVPRAIARLYAEPILYYTWPFWRALGTLLAPPVLGARFVDAVFHRLAGRVPEVPDEESFEDEIRTIVTEGHREGLLERWVIRGFRPTRKTATTSWAFSMPRTCCRSWLRGPRGRCPRGLPCCARPTSSPKRSPSTCYYRSSNARETTWR